MRITCKGHWSSSTTDSPPEFYCDYEPPFDCGDCICNGGRMSPVSGKPFRGNPEPYVQAFLNREYEREPKTAIEFDFP